MGEECYEASRQPMATIYGLVPLCVSRSIVRGGDDLGAESDPQGANTETGQGGGWLSSRLQM